jgi:hypothetical protein
LVAILRELIQHYVPLAPLVSPVPWHPKVPPFLRRARSAAWTDYRTSRASYGRSSHHALSKLALFQQINIRIRDSTRINVRPMNWCWLAKLQHILRSFIGIYVQRKNAALLLGLSWLVSS